MKEDQEKMKEDQKLMMKELKASIADVLEQLKKNKH